MPKMPTKDQVSAVIDWLLWHVLPEWLYRKLPDHCERCAGKRGGVRGNENVSVDSSGKRVVVCDYCSADDLPKKPGS